MLHGVLRALARVALLAPLSAAVLVPATARADEKAACFDAAENAQRLRRESKLQQARAELLTCSRDVCPQIVRRDCAGWLTEVTASQPTVVVAARDANGRDFTDVKVTVDGKPFLQHLQGAAVPIDPGDHVFRYEFADGRSTTEKILIVSGEKDRVIHVEINKPPAKAAGAAAPSRPTEAPATPAGPGPGPWVIGGVGVAGLVVFGVLQGVAQSKYAKLEDGCAKTKTCDPGEVSAVRTQLIASGVSLGVGAAALVTGVTWLLVSSRKRTEAAPKVALDLTPQPGGAVLTFGGRF
ncbi:Hypothetical protein A7982_05776 [Minicystis rosea]|nr:Hypothetical protein A7982_05776 [Minicystis rosea]